MILVLPPSLCVPLSVLITRAARAVARDFRHTFAMRQSVDITFYYPGSARCWAQITAARSPLRMENIHGRPVVAAISVSESALPAMMNVFIPSHPCQVTLGLFPESPTFVAADRLRDARARHSFSKSYIRTNSMLDDVCDAWV